MIPPELRQRLEALIDEAEAGGTDGDLAVAGVLIVLIGMDDRNQLKELLWHLAQIVEQMTGGQGARDA